MKQPSEWDESYILSLPAGEHDWLEFKDARSLDFSLPGVDENKVLDDLSKQLSAFANSGGGTIVYGVKDSSGSGARAISGGGVSLMLRGRSTKEWLEDVIPNLVEYPLMSFNVYVVARTGSSSEIGADGGVILIHVADSENAPHQARDKKYYARVGGKSRPIGHRMVMDIAGRSKHPKMELSLRLVRKGGHYKWCFFCLNTGRIYANYVNMFIYMPSELLPFSSHYPTEVIDGITCRVVSISNIHKDLVDSQIVGLTPISKYVTRYNPVLPGLGFSEYVLAAAPSNNASHHKVFWSIYADNAPVEDGEIEVNLAEINRDEES